MRVWVDDNRQPVGDWVWVKTYDAAIALFENETGITDVSLDHDLGLIWDPADDDMRILPAIELQGELSGYHIILWMVSNDYWPESLSVHSMNVVGASNIRDVIERYSPYVYREAIFYPTFYGGEIPAVRYTRT